MFSLKHVHIDPIIYFERKSLLRDISRLLLFLIICSCSGTVQIKQHPIPWMTMQNVLYWAFSALHRSENSVSRLRWIPVRPTHCPNSLSSVPVPWKKFPLSLVCFPLTMFSKRWEFNEIRRHPNRPVSTRPEWCPPPVRFLAWRRLSSDPSFFITKQTSFSLSLQGSEAFSSCSCPFIEYYPYDVSETHLLSRYPLFCAPPYLLAPISFCY